MFSSKVLETTVGVLCLIPAICLVAGAAAEALPSALNWPSSPLLDRVKVLIDYAGIGIEAESLSNRSAAVCGEWDRLVSNGLESPSLWPRRANDGAADCQARARQSRDEAAEASSG